MFDERNWELVKQYWTTRTLVPVADEPEKSNEVRTPYGNRRVVIKSYSPVDRFRTKISATLEFWAV